MLHVRPSRQLELSGNLRVFLKVTVENLIATFSQADEYNLSSIKLNAIVQVQV